MKKIMFLIVLISALTAVSVYSENDKSPADIQDSSIAEILNAHNRYRGELNIPPLKWSPELAKHAKEWADRLAGERKMYHSSGSGEGENLWSGTSGYYSLTQMVDAWGGEKKYYRDGKFPNVSSSGSWFDVGHYTQIIWRNTTEVGCAKSTGYGNDYFVCRYSPPGNYMGQKVY